MDMVKSAPSFDIDTASGSMVDGFFGVYPDVLLMNSETIPAKVVYPLAGVLPAGISLTFALQRPAAFALPSCSNRKFPLWEKDLRPSGEKTYGPRGKDLRPWRGSLLGGEASLSNTVKIGVPQIGDSPQRLHLAHGQVMIAPKTSDVLEPKFVRSARGRNAE